MWKDIPNMILSMISIHDILRYLNKKLDNLSHKTKPVWDDKAVDEYIIICEKLMKEGTIPDHFQIRLAGAFEQMAMKKMKR
jgi:hypothetical protein